MAEGRMLKKKISTDVDVADLENPWDIILFTWGISHLDIEGRITGDPREYRALVAPLLENITKETVSGFFQKAIKIGLIQRYSVDGKWAVQFPGFKKNQSLRPDKEGASAYPAPPEKDNGPLPEQDGITPGPLPEQDGITPAEVKLSKGKGSKEKLKEEKIGASPPPPPGGNGDARPAPKNIFSCECFEVSQEFFTELTQGFPLLPPEHITSQFSNMRDWCLDNRKLSKHSKKFLASGQLRTPRRFIKNWLQREEPAKVQGYITPPRAPTIPETPPGIMVFDPNCPVCHGDAFKTLGRCKCGKPENSTHESASGEGR